jgi:hypothetical protein
MAVATSRAPSVILPDALYTRRGFMVVSGLCEAKLREAKQKYRLEPKRFWVGKRCYIKGSDAILFLEELSHAETQAHLAELRAEAVDA